MWFYLNNKTKKSILTPLGETDHATIMNGIGQGSFAAALASSLNIGRGVESITKGVRSANIGELELNSLIFQDDIAKMNYSMEDARKCATDVDVYKHVQPCITLYNQAQPCTNLRSLLQPCTTFYNIVQLCTTR